MWAGIKTIFWTVINSIIEFATTTFEEFKRFLSTLWENIKTAVEIAWNNIKSTVEGIIKGIVEGADRAWEQLKRSVSDAIDKVKGFFNSLSEIDLFEAGASIIRGFLNGLKSAFERVKSFVSGIAEWIRNNKGPIEYDRKLLIPAGNAIMESLDEGLTDKFALVKRTVSSIAGQINKGFTSEITDIEIGSSISKDLSIDDMSTADFNFTDKNEDVVNALHIVQDLLEKISNKDYNTYLDGEPLAKNSYDRQMTFIRREGI